MNRWRDCVSQNLSAGYVALVCILKEGQNKSKVRLSVARKRAKYPEMCSISLLTVQKGKHRKRRIQKQKPTQRRMIF